jgi:hypothetical protein
MNIQRWLIPSCLILIIIAPLSVFCAQFNATSYPNQLTLSPTYNLYWRIENATEIYLALQVNTTGWVRFIY